MHLPLADRIRVAYSSFGLWFGLLFVGVGAFVVSVSDWRCLYFYLGPVATAPGRIVATYPTSYAVDEVSVRGLTYRYPARDLAWAGTSYTTDSLLQPGQTAPVAYCVSNPAVSRLVGTSLAPFGFTGLLSGLAFALCGACLMLKSAWRTRKLLIITADAGLADATRQASRQRTVYTDDKEFEFRYAYTAHHQLRVLLVYAATANHYREQEVVVFEQANPTNALLLSTLPTFLQDRLTAHG